MDHEMLSEFCIPANEIDTELETGDLGKLVLSVEVIGKVNGMYVFRKHKKAIAEGNFRPESAKDMRDRLVEKQDATEDATDSYDSPEE